jgi:hypothetical protein
MLQQKKSEPKSLVLKRDEGNNERAIISGRCFCFSKSKKKKEDKKVGIHLSTRWLTPTPKQEVIIADSAQRNKKRR